MISNPYFIPSVILIALFTAYIFIWIILKSPLITFFRDKPGLRKVHQRVIPRIGGIAILISFVSFVIIWNRYFPQWPQLPKELFSALIFTALAIMIVGVLDDMVIFQIKNRAKFLLEVVIAAEVVFINGICLNDIHFLNWDFSLGWIGIPITILWIVGVTNAINIIDGVDGLAGSIMLVVFCTVAMLTGFSHDYAILFLCIIFIGLISGFLIHNISPARVFLGDTGSLFLGMTIGILSIYLVSREENAYPLLIAPLIVGLPVMDVFVAMVRRFTKTIMERKSWLKALSAMTVADNEHMHHRLIFRGLTHTETVIILVLFHAVICMSAIMIVFTSNTQNLLLLTYILFLGIWVLYKLQFFDGMFGGLGKHKQLYQPKPLNIGVVNSGSVLKCSLSKYSQDVFHFQFCSQTEIIAESKKFTAVIIEQNDVKIDKMLMLASTIFSENTCPVIIIGSQDELPESLLDQVLEQGLFLFLKKPVYIPILMKALDRLIQQSKGWSMDRVTEDTRQFYLQAVVHEEV